MLSCNRVLVPLAVLCSSACASPPTQVTSGSDTSDSSSTSVAPPSTTIPDEDTTAGSQGSSGVDTTMGVDPTTGGSTTMGVDPTTSGSTTMGVDPTTSGSTTGDPPPECTMSSDCGSNEICDGMGQCMDACGGMWGVGNYDYCLDAYGQFATMSLCGSASDLCVWGGTPIEVATCSAQACTGPCDCPPPPGTGNAVVSCGPITGDAVDDCYLSCGSGETCPDGMICRASVADSYCAWPAQPLAMYGDCGGVAAPCENGGVCAMATNGMSTWSVCVDDCPGGTGDCDPAPTGALLGEGCGDVIDPPLGSECHLECTVLGDCPAGMICITVVDGGTFCMWP